MEKVSKAVLKEAANKLLFNMNEEEYDALLVEFEYIDHQMELISQIEGVDETTPMSFPYPISASFLREDEASEPISREEALKNVKDKDKGMIRLPKVVG